MLNLKPIFKCSLLKIVGGPLSPMGCALGSFGHSLAYVKICAGSAPWGPKYDLSKKLIWVGWSESACSSSTVLLVDQSSPDFFRQTREESLSIASFRFWITPSVTEIFASEV